MRMTWRQVRRYLKAIPEIRAAEQMEEALVAQFPHMTAAGRREAIHRWQREAGLDAEPEVPVVPKEGVRDFFRALGAARGF